MGDKSKRLGSSRRDEKLGSWTAVWAAANPDVCLDNDDPDFDPGEETSASPQPKESDPDRSFFGDAAYGENTVPYFKRESP